jgi:hypothetical protein
MTVLVPILLALFFAMTTRMWRNVEKEVKMDALKGDHFV